MAKITPKKKNTGERETITVKTKDSSVKTYQPKKWWKCRTKQERAEQVVSTAAFLKKEQGYRYRQTALFARLYSNFPLYGWIGANLQKPSVGQTLPSDRPTLNVIQSCVDTLVSRITQSKPRPMFLTERGDYKQRNLAKQLNNFIQGEFYRVKAYEKGENAFKENLITGTGILKVCEKEKKVHVERRLVTELLTDPNDAIFGEPRQLFELSLVDRDVLLEMFPDAKSEINTAEQAYAEAQETTQTIADQVMVVEAWHLPSSEDADDGLHIIASTAGPIFEEKWTKERFPFAFDHYSKRLLGFWSQGLCEQLMGTQVEINKLLQTISASINLVGVPRVFVEDGSKVVSAHLNNQIGAIVKYRGTKPSYEVAPCIPQEVYAQLERLVQYAYQQSGVSALAASAQKPAGLNSGEAIRNYDDLQTDRFAKTSKDYETFYEDLAFLIFDTAKDIAKKYGKYSTVYPAKDGTRRIDLPKIALEKDDMVIQCFDVSSLPKDPAGRLQKITEMIQAGMIDIREGRRLLDFPDLEQVEKLATASEERILQYLDKIVEEGEFNPPDPFMDLQLAEQLVTQYYNLYVAAKLEEDRADMLRDFHAQIMSLKAEAAQAQLPAPGQAAGQPVGVPAPRPQSDLMPMVPQTVPGAA